MQPDIDLHSEKAKELKEALVKERSLWRLPALEKLLLAFTPGERLALYAFSVLLGLSTLVLLLGLNAEASVTVPARGGSLTEGEVGPARFINPILTISQPDQDITELVYSGLMRAMPDGTYVPDLASSYEISPDGTTYTFHLRPGATFQDGTPVTAADVLFTVEMAQDPDINSPRRADWEGVQVSSPDPETVVFKLPHPYAPFIENTTMGILPKHVWQNVSPQEFPYATANTHPVGSGPYEVTNVATDNTGSPIRYDLTAFRNYTLGEPYLTHISFLFYDNTTDMLQAFNAGQIDAVAGISPSKLSGVTRTNVAEVRATLPRAFGVFFNQTHDPALADRSAREALDAAVDKRAIVNDVLGGFGVPLSGPIPPGLLGTVAPAVPTAFSAGTPLISTSTPNSADIDAARAILQNGGWKFNSSNNTWTKGKTTLSLTLSTANEPELLATANAVAADWRALGVQVTVQVYSLADLNTNVIRPRNYDALLFGEVVGRELDLFAFWHSSQRNDPGLNLAMYANSKVDALLSQARAATDTQTRDKLYAQFSAQIENDMPAVFLYAPQFIYLVPKSLQGVELGALTTPAERFLNVYQWYAYTEQVWSIFTNRS